MTNETTDAPSASGYEFDEAQDVVIRDLAGAMKFVGTVSVVLAIVLWLTGIATMFMGNPAGIAQIVQGVLLAFIGVWTRNGATSFQLVVDTQGSDIQNLMNALGELRRLYNLQRWMMVVMLVFIVLTFLGITLIWLFYGSVAHF